MFHSKECVYQYKKEVYERIAIVRREKITNTEDPEINDCELRMESLGVLIIKKMYQTKTHLIFTRKTARRCPSFAPWSHSMTKVWSNQKRTELHGFLLEGFYSGHQCLGLFFIKYSW